MGVKREEAFSGTSIKDTCTKPKGCRIEGGRWGWLGWDSGEGNRDNCTLTTINR